MTERELADEYAERKQSEEMLRLLSAAVKQSTEGVAVSDLEGNLLFVNNAFATMHGYAPEELIGKHLSIFHTPEQMPAVNAANRQMQEKGEFSGEIWHVRCDGAVFPTLMHNSLLRKEAGNPIGMIGTIRDITERKKAEEKLIRSRKEYIAVTNLTGDLIERVDKEGRWTFLNDSACRFWGKPREKLLGVEFAYYLHPDDAEKTKAAIQEMIETKQIVRGLVNRQKTPRGWRTVEWNGTPIFDEAGNYAGFQATGRDITERRRMEEKLRESEERYRDLIEKERDIIYTLDYKGNITFASPAVETILGFRPEELIGKNFMVLIPKEWQEKTGADFNNLLKIGEITAETALLGKKGQPHFVEYSSTVIKKDNKVVGTRGIVRDIIERKRMEEKLKQYTEHLEEMVEERTRELKEAQQRLLKTERMAAIGATAAMVGHDLRNPLQVIANTLYLAKQKLESMPSRLAEKQSLKELCGGIKEQVEYMDKIVSDLQDYARPLKPEPIETSLYRLFNDTLSTINVPETIHVSLVIKKDFPRLMVDPILMKRVFVNLVTNALQAMPDGGKLTIRASKTGGAASISIQDTGVGIPEENIPKLFQPLFTTKSKGTGFGLPVCKRIVEAHNGSITVKSKVGGGSTFTVRIPLTGR